MKWSNSIRKWSRLIHRDLSFFFSGMVLIYAISGIVMNHRDTINPNFSITRKEYKIAEKLPDKAGMNKEEVLTLLEPLGESGNYTKHYFPKTDVMKVFLKGGSNLLVNVKTGEAVYESVTRRPLIGAMSRLHYNPGQWWTYFADIFAIALIIITLSGIIMDYGKILIQKPIAELLEKGRRYTFTIPEGYELPASDDFYHPSVMRNQLETFSFLQPAETEAKLKSMSVPYTNFHSEQVNLEDAFIGLTGKY